MRIVVLGYIIRGPLGGLCWHHLQYILGLKHMGHEVLFLEDSDNYASCYNPHTFAISENPLYGLQFIEHLFSSFDLLNNWAYYDAHTENWFGLSKKKVFSFCDNADVILNISGVNPVREWWAHIPSRVFIDTDPAFTQIKILTEPAFKALASVHTTFFSFAENIVNKSCSIPQDGFSWKVTRQPVFIDAWQIAPLLPKAKWTTVMQWDSYKMQQYEGKMYGMKSSSFNDYWNLPEKISDSFELAIGSDSAPREKLKQAGWYLSNPLMITLNANTYQQYIQQSKGEWSVAKHGYVITNSGWFSERSAVYLASGRPVVVQDTGFSKIFEIGRGLFSFRSPSEVIAAIEEINQNYPKHCYHAREMAEVYFRADKVLASLLDQLN